MNYRDFFFVCFDLPFELNIIGTLRKIFQVRISLQYQSWEWYKLDKPPLILVSQWRFSPTCGKVSLRMTWWKWPLLKIGKVMFSAKWHLAVHSFAHKWNKTLQPTNAAGLMRLTHTVQENCNGSALAHQVDKFYVHWLLCNEISLM